MMNCKETGCGGGLFTNAKHPPRTGNFLEMLGEGEQRENEETTTH